MRRAARCPRILGRESSQVPSRPNRRLRKTRTLTPSKARRVDCLLLWPHQQRMAHADDQAIRQMRCERDKQMQSSSRNACGAKDTVLERNDKDAEPEARWEQLSQVRTGKCRERNETKVARRPLVRPRGHQGRAPSDRQARSLHCPLRFPFLLGQVHRPGQPQYVVRPPLWGNDLS